MKIHSIATQPCADVRMGEELLGCAGKGLEKVKQYKLDSLKRSPWMFPQPKVNLQI